MARYHKPAAPPRFDPATGVIVEESPKEFVARLLESGEFDGLSTVVIIGSNDRDLCIHKTGPLWEVMALCQYAGRRFYEFFQRD